MAICRPKFTFKKITDDKHNKTTKININFLDVFTNWLIKPYLLKGCEYDWK